MKTINDAIQYLSAVSDKLTPSAQSLYAVQSNGKRGIILDRGSRYIAAEVVVGSGEKELLKPGIDRQVGITDFDGNRLNDMSNLIVGKIHVGYATNANSGKADVLKYDAAASGSVHGAELTVRQDGEVVFRESLSSFLPKGTPASVRDLDVELDAFFMLIEGKNTSVKIEFPQGAAAHATLKEYLKIHFKGWETKRR